MRWICCGHHMAMSVHLSFFCSAVCVGLRRIAWAVASKDPSNAAAERFRAAGKHGRNGRYLTGATETAGWTARKKLHGRNCMEERRNMSKHKALKGAIAAVASVATLGALQPSATATPRRSQARRWQVCGRIHRIQRRCSAFLRAQGQVRQRGLRFRQLHSGLRRACQDRQDQPLKI